MDLDEIMVFVKVVETGSFTKAAGVLGMTKSTVSFKVAQLEERLHCLLLHRTTRSLRLTTDGELFFKTCSRALSEIDSARAVVGSKHAKPEGPLRVSVPTALGIHLLPNFVAGFSTRYPGIKLKIIVTNRFVDFVEDGIDVAIRAGGLKDSSLVARRIGTSHFSLFASPKYLKRRGEPKSPEDLLKYECLSFAPIGTNWSLIRKAKTVDVQVDDRIVVDDITLLKELALNGSGIALIPAFAGREEIAKGKLLQVLPQWHAHATGIFAVTSPQRHQHNRVRVFVDEIVKAFAKEFDFSDG